MSEKEQQTRRHGRCSAFVLGSVAVIVVGTIFSLLYGLRTTVGFWNITTATSTTNGVVLVIDETNATTLTATTTGSGYNNNNTSSSVSEEEQEQQREREPIALPERLIVVTGLESSGTNFVTKIIATALGKKGRYRKACKGGPQDNSDIWIQHVSQPSMKSCTRVPFPRAVQKVILPPVCTVREDGRLSKHFHPDCAGLAEAANITTNAGGRAECPGRYLLDLVAQKEFYRDHLGVDVWYVIVVREPSISRNGRWKSVYCRNETLLLEEERLGQELIDRAIYRYILEEDYDADHHRQRSRRRLLLSEPNSTTLTSGNGVFLVSFETLLKLQNVYVRMIYSALGIESDHVPDFDLGANAKYVLETGVSSRTYTNRFQRRPPVVYGGGLKKTNHIGNNVRVNDGVRVVGVGGGNTHQRPDGRPDPRHYDDHGVSERQRERDEEREKRREREIAARRGAPTMTPAEP